MVSGTYTALALLAIVAVAGQPAFSRTVPSLETKNFIQQAVIGNQFEISSSNLALQRAIAPEVKGFAAMMVSDHTKVADKLKKTLDGTDIDIKLPRNLDSSHQKTLDELKAATAESFDGLYIQAQTNAHDEAVSLFERYTDEGDNADLKTFSSDTLPILKAHQEKIHTMQHVDVRNGRLNKKASNEATDIDDETPDSD